MREFFKGWRRKAGFVTLVMACVCSAGWIRSLTATDAFLWDVKAFGITTKSMHGVVAITLGAYDRQFKWSFPEITSEEFRSLDEDCRRHVAWQWNLAGLRFGGNNQPVAGTFVCVVVIPYPLVAILLTLLSAYLLLVKPRVAKPNKAVEPTPAEGT